MNRRFALAAALAALSLTAAPALAAPKKAAAKPAPKQVPLPDTVRVAMVTEKGTIKLDLDHKRAPITVENFVRYVDARKFDGMAFYRAMRLNWGTQPNGLIQTGLQSNPLKVFKPIAHEPTSQTGILHKAGAVSMARYAPGTAMADFSILLADLPSLDADPKSTNAESQAGFAAFGHVVSGMDVVKAIWDSPVSPTKGEGPLKGQMLEPPVKVLTVRRIASPVVP
ncbi:peptidyl-prolyl cis-trans isomerase A (cyclophilin A) [Novosphingobium kunmingense]|uniref:peptidylprolyl isomerase n=1 Tax=Novosphingobium kunmingense TaxID=1211806 RepID=A0A2N0I418_9SPHN|nr:peptidylprolyl isomerase [Novosphingobium kunmingense]PKB25927.1 peptidyl-prolyl cis-trans isomerase A (cyclophilin A) [Novosphingobium kunmingense]